MSQRGVNSNNTRTAELTGQPSHMEVKSNAVEELKNPFSRPFFIVFVQVNGSNYMPDISRWHFKTQMKILWL